MRSTTIYICIYINIAHVYADAGVFIVKQLRGYDYIIIKRVQKGEITAVIGTA